MVSRCLVCRLAFGAWQAAKHQRSALNYQVCSRITECHRCYLAGCKTPPNISEYVVAMIAMWGLGLSNWPFKMRQPTGLRFARMSVHRLCRSGWHCDGSCGGTLRGLPRPVQWHFLPVSNLRIWTDSWFKHLLMLDAYWYMLTHIQFDSASFVSFQAVRCCNCLAQDAGFRQSKRRTSTTFCKIL